MNGDFLAYAEFQGFWARFSPETPFGREAKDPLRIYTDPGELQVIWDQTEWALGLLDDLDADPLRLNRISHHLKRLPRFPLEPRASYSEVELFQFKKFLHNYHALGALLGPVGARFGLGGGSEAFAQLLDTGRQSAESFHVADEYSSELKAVREQIRQTDAATRDERQNRLNEIQTRWGLEFGFREFLLVPRAQLTDPAVPALLLVEPYDDSHSVVRPLRSAAELMLAEQRSNLQAREAGLEEEVLVTLAHAARLELAAFAGYLEAVRSFDLAFARARLARAYGLTRPILAAGPVRIQGGRFIPCQEACTARGSAYVALDACFDTSVSVLFGSNMGGKTVVLKTLAFLQLCVQTGLFVPALAFHTRPFRHLHYVGEGASKDSSQGLSGFGCEIRQFNAAWSDFQEPTLALFDEFARTTQSQEAEGLLAAVQEAMTGVPASLALFSTHFRGVRRCPGARYLRMRGLDRAGLEAEGTVPPEQRIQAINRHMDYRLAADDGSRAVSDALAVAGLLGLDPAIRGRAEVFFHQDH